MSRERFDVSVTQTGFRYRFEWGPNGLRALAPSSDVVVIVDVLRFTSAVSAALEAGAVVLPYRWDDDGVARFAQRHDAQVLADGRHRGQALSPARLLGLASGTRVALPSPNGSALAFAARDHGARHVLAGCLRNARATARRAQELAGPSGVVTVLGAGERWRGETGPLRPAVEDLLGAGAVLAALDEADPLPGAQLSPEAAAAAAAFLAARAHLADALATCSSGRELTERGADHDITVAAALDVTDLAAELVGEAFLAIPPR